MFDRDVFSLGAADLFEAPSEAGRHGCVGLECCGVKESDHRHRRLLCSR
jgi:hypothetical protein